MEGDVVGRSVADVVEVVDGADPGDVELELLVVDDKLAEALDFVLVELLGESSRGCRGGLSGGAGTWGLGLDLVKDGVDVFPVHGVAGGQRSTGCLVRGEGLHEGLVAGCGLIAGHGFRVLGV